MPSSPFVRHLSLLTAVVLGLSACGSNDGASTNTVAMKNLEVVDGTASDAMTDLDGVKSESPAAAPLNGSNVAASSPPKAAGNSVEPADTEVIADQ